MRVAIDVSPLAQTRAGTARYLRGLVPELKAVPDVELVPVAFPGSKRAATVVRDALWYPAGLPLRIRRARVDILHCPTFRGPIRSPAPLVVTVHDVAVLLRPEAFNRWTRLYSRVAVPRVVGAADRVIAVSEFTRRELVERLAVPAEKIRVVPNGVAAPFTPDGPQEDGDYVLAVGTIEPRKNIPRVAEAARRAGAELRVVGAVGWGRVDAALDGAVQLGFVDDAELARLYRGARCLVYPSLYEGFGLPVLEAMACGTPVVTSAGGATEELADGAAVLVDPLDPGSIAGGIEQAVARRDELVRRGLERAGRYSWRAAAAATADVYRELA